MSGSSAAMLTVLCWLLLFSLLRVRATDGKEKFPSVFLDARAGETCVQVRCCCISGVKDGMALTSRVQPHKSKEVFYFAFLFWVLEI